MSEWSAWVGLSDKVAAGRACGPVNSDDFYAADRTDDECRTVRFEDKVAQSRAVATCVGCPVRRECAQLGRDEKWGVWGGLTPVQRKAWRRTGVEPEPLLAAPKMPVVRQDADGAWWRLGRDGKWVPQPLPRRVDAARVQVIVERLVQDGWRFDVLGRELGLSDRTLRELASGVRRQVLPETSEVVEEAAVRAGLLVVARVDGRLVAVRGSAVCRRCECLWAEHPVGSCGVEVVE